MADRLIDRETADGRLPLVHRRRLLQAGAVGLVGLGLGELLAGEANAAAKPAARLPGFGRARSCLFIFLKGGPSHLDTFDPKPDAPAEVRGTFRTLATNVPGITFTEHVPYLANVADKLTVVRSLTHKDTGHPSAAYEMTTGHPYPRGMNLADTGTLIVDGARRHPEHEVKPGETARVRLEIPLPGEDGAYQVLLSPMREDVCWYYEQGWPFLLVEATTESGVVRVDRVRVATRATLARERAVRSVGRAFIYPVTTLWRNRSLIRVMVRRDILGRYRGSFGGAFWTIINPLLLMLTYFFVFGVVLRDRYDPKASWSSFALYFLAGMLPWLAFSEAAGRAPSVMLEHRNFVKKLVFAVETLPVNLVVAGLVTELFAIALYCVFLLAINHELPGALLWLPVLLIPQILFTAGMSWFLAALGVFVRDLGQVMGFVLTLWFFLTPICYPEGKLPPAAAGILTKNPIYVLVHGYRSIFLHNQAPAFGGVWKLWLVATVVFLLGHAWFYKLRKSFPDLL